MDDDGDDDDDDDDDAANDIKIDAGFVFFASSQTTSVFGGIGMKQAVPILDVQDHRFLHDLKSRIKNGLRIFPASKRYFSRLRDFFRFDLVFFALPGYFFCFRRDFSRFGKRYFSHRNGSFPLPKKKIPTPKGIFPLRRRV